MTADKKPLLPFGALNPPPNNDTGRKMHPTMDDFFHIAILNSVQQTFGPKSKTNEGVWRAVVLRVERFDDCMVTLKARIPEKDGTIPEPTEWVPNVKSRSHQLIDLHRTYRGTSNTAPGIGQIIEVEIPKDNNPSKDGKLLKLLNEFVVDGIKTTITSASAQKAANAPLPNHGATGENRFAKVPSTCGDAIGSGQRDPSSQVCASDSRVLENPTATTDAAPDHLNPVSSENQTQTEEYMQACAGAADVGQCAANQAVGDVERQQAGYEAEAGAQHIGADIEDRDPYEEGQYEEYNANGATQ